MAAFELKTFIDIIDAVREELKIQSTDTVTTQRIKRDINMVYVNEVIAKNRWKWLRDKIDLRSERALTTGTAAVTLDSREVTLSATVANSLRGQFFSVQGDSDRYRISQHTAGSASFTLEVAYASTTNATVSYKIWTDSIPLPSEAREVIQAYIDKSQVPLEGWGQQDFIDHVLMLPDEEGRPRIYTTNEYINPNPYAAVVGIPAISTRASNGLVKTLVYAADVSSFLEAGDRVEVIGAGIDSYNGRFVISSVTTDTITYTGTKILKQTTTADAGITLLLADNRGTDETYRDILIHPAIDDQNHLVHVNYIKNVKPMEADSDEPVLPIEDRIVLLYGALHKAWSRERNTEEAARNRQLFVAKLSLMLGKLDDSTDTAKLRISKTYLSVKRNMNRFWLDFRRFD